MAMNSREKLLAGGVGVLAALFLGSTFVSSIQSGFDAKKDLIDSLTKKKEEQALQLTASKVAFLKLNKLIPKSLPRTEELAIGDYQKWLLSLGEEAQLTAPALQNTGESKEKDGSYVLYKFKLAGTGTIENARNYCMVFTLRTICIASLNFRCAPLRIFPNPIK